MVATRTRKLLHRPPRRQSQTRTYQGKEFFVRFLLVGKQKINQSIFNLEKSQGRSLMECPTCHVPPRSDPSALR